jgi:hypothetical protein
MNWVEFPWERIVAMVMDDKLTKTDVKVFHHLWGLVRSGKPIPSQLELSYAVLGDGGSRTTINVCIGRLHDLGLLVSPPRKPGSGKVRKIEIPLLSGIPLPIRKKKKPIINSKTPSEEKTAPLGEAVDCCATCFYWSYSRASYHECRGNQTPNAGRDPLRICRLFLRRI